MTIMWLVYMPAISKQVSFWCFKLFNPGDKYLICKDMWIWNSTAKDKEQSLNCYLLYLHADYIYQSSVLFNFKGRLWLN